jgi:beta-glucosidase
MKPSRSNVLITAIVLAVGVTIPLAGLSVPPAAATSCVWMNRGETPAQRTSQLLAAMSLDDKITMVTGDGGSGGGNVNTGAAGLINGNSALCIPPLVLNDATAGMGDGQVLTTAFPDSIGLTATWDRDLTQQYGIALGKEAFAKGVNVVLGPGLDIARNPLNGRNFEYAGEDPYLAGQAGAAMVRGIQAEPVVATVKHYALNDQETNRDTDSSDASERTMQEIHLPAYEAAVAQGGAGAAMCSYNRVNATYACENPYLLTSVLKQQFGFNGWVMSDWGATHSTAPTANAGMDMEMPGGPYYGAALKAAVQAGTVALSRLNDMVYRIAFTMFRLGLFDHVPNEGSQAALTNASTPESIATATKVAEDGTVLLKNAGGVLPLSGPAKRIAVIGAAASQPGATEAEQGYGSGHVPQLSYQPGVVAPLTSLTTRGAQAGDVVSYADGTSTVDAVAAATAADVAVVFINDVEIEGADRPDLHAHSGTCSFVNPAGVGQGTCYYSAVDQDKLVSAVAAANPRTIVVVQSGGPVAMPWANSVAGIVENWFPGQVDGDAIAPILFGDVNPSGKLPVTFPVTLGDGPLKSAQQYPGVVDAQGIPHSSYSEGLLVGYRWYNAMNVKPLFPFGFGLSYTSFQYSGLKVTTTKTGVTVQVSVTNTGPRAGADVAQTYVTDPAVTGEPPLQLKGFDKVFLLPGQTKTVTMALDSRAFASWNPSKHAWNVTAGNYLIHVGDSSDNRPLSTTIRVGASG